MTLGIFRFILKEEICTLGTGACSSMDDPKGPLVTKVSEGFFSKKRLPKAEKGFIRDCST